MDMREAQRRALVLSSLLAAAHVKEGRAGVRAATFHKPMCTWLKEHSGCEGAPADCLAALEAATRRSVAMIGANYNLSHFDVLAEADSCLDSLCTVRADVDAARLRDVPAPGTRPRPRS